MKEQVIIHENKVDYSPAEAAILKQAYDNLDVKAQGGNLTLEETRIRVAYIRYKREDDFKIAVKSTRTKKEGVTKSTSGQKRITKKSKKQQIMDDIAEATILLFKKNNGEKLTQEEEDFLELMTQDPPGL